MYVFIANVPGMNMQLLPFRDVLEHLTEFLFNEQVSQYLSTVFGTPDNVVVTHP